MNKILDAAGAVLYFIVSIVLIPIFLLTDAFLWTLITLRWTQTMLLRLQKAWAHRKPWHLPHSFSLHGHFKSDLVRIFSRSGR